MFKNIVHSVICWLYFLYCNALTLKSCVRAAYLTIIYILTVDMLKPGNTVIIRNAKIDMFKGSMRLAVDKWGRVEVTEPASFDVKEDNNLSLVEYELVNVEE